MSASPFEAELDTALVDSVQTVPVGDVADNDAGALRVGTPLSAVDKWGLGTPPNTKKLHERIHLAGGEPLPHGLRPFDQNRWREERSFVA